MEEPLLFTPRQVARGLGVSESSVKRWIDAQRLPAYRTPGGHRRVPLAAVVRFARERGAELLHPEALGLGGLAAIAALTGGDEPPLQRALDVLEALGVALDAVGEGITVADLRRPDQPLVFANRAFYTLTGYTPEETLGRNCRFLQGPGTDPEAIRILRHALDRGEAVTIELLNYRKDGSPFWNRLSLAPVPGSGGRPTHYVGVQRDVTRRP